MCAVPCFGEHMNPKQLVDMLMALVNSQGLTDEQRFETIGRFNTAMLGGASTTSITSTNTQSQVVEAPKPTAQGPVVIAKGQACKCNECKKVAYTVVRDVQDQMPDEMFRNCFEPPLPKDGELWGDQQGNVAIDCPLCHSEFTVWIKGEGSYSGTQDMPDNFLSRE